MTVKERIENRIKIDKSGCWLWQGATSNGYGRIRVLGKTKKVHRVYWEIVNGLIPEGMYICHHCDICNCINPKHLFLGTHTDNMRDMIKKERKSIVVWNTNKTHCKREHLLHGDNIYSYIYYGRKTRQCKLCKKLRVRRKTNG